MKKNTKRLIMFLFTLSVSVIGAAGMTGMNGKSDVAFAHVVSTTSASVIFVNDTKDTAYQLQQNTLADSLVFSPKKVDNCFLSDSNDTDWYKVFLYAGTQTLTINSSNNNKIAEVVSADGMTTISTGTFGPSTKQSQKFQISQSGTYYIKIHSNESFSTKSNYSIFVGAPWYKNGTYSKSLNTNLSLTPTKKISSIVIFDLSLDYSIPSSAIVKHIYLNGTEVNKYAVDGKVRSIKAGSQSLWTDISGIVFFDKDVLNTTNPLPLKQGWSFKHSVSSFYSGYTSYSLNPVVKFDYLYEDSDI